MPKGLSPEQPMLFPPSLRVRGIAIRDFRGIQSLDLDFVGLDDKALDLVVLGGPNGCGKTAILEACLLALGRKDLLAFRAKGGPDTRVGASQYSIRATVECDDRPYQGEVPEREQKVPLRPIDPPELWKERPISYFTCWRGPSLKGPLPVRAGKPGRRPSETELNRLPLLKQDLIDSKAYSLMRGPGDRWFEEAIRKLETVWHRFFPDARERFIVEPVGETHQEGFDVFLQRDGIRLSVDLLSSGELEILTFAGWFLLNDHSGGVIVIDEPEQHLHVQWHRAILSALRELQPRTQFIVATHSPEILDSVRSHERFLLLPAGDPRQVAGAKVRSEGEA